MRCSAKAAVAGVQMVCPCRPRWSLWAWETKQRGRGRAAVEVQIVAGKLEVLGPGQHREIIGARAIYGPPAIGVQAQVVQRNLHTRAWQRYINVEGLPPFPSKMFWYARRCVVRVGAVGVRDETRSVRSYGCAPDSRHVIQFESRSGMETPNTQPGAGRVQGPHVRDELQVPAAAREAPRRHRVGRAVGQAARRAGAGQAVPRQRQDAEQGPDRPRRRGRARPQHRPRDVREGHGAGASNGGGRWLLLCDDDDADAQILLEHLRRANPDTQSTCDAARCARASSTRSAP